MNKINHILVTHTVGEPFAYIHFTKQLQRGAEVKEVHPQRGIESLSDTAELWFPCHPDKVRFIVHAIMVKHRLIGPDDGILLTNEKAVEVGDGRWCTDYDIEGVV